MLDATKLIGEISLPSVSRPSSVSERGPKAALNCVPTGPIPTSLSPGFDQFRKSVGGKKQAAACTALLSRSTGSFASGWPGPPWVAIVSDKWPPALAPVMPSLPGFTPYLGALCRDRKSTRLNSSHGYISYAVFCLKKKKKLIHI